MKNLAEVPVEEQKKFLDSFDHIFCDMDGVIWLSYNPIPGASECLNHLKKIGKKLTFVTNNTFSSKESIYSHLKQSNFDITNTEIVNPTYAIIAYLKSIKFNKLIFAIGTKELKKELQENGFSLFPDPPSHIETISDLIANIEGDARVGAISVNFDFNLTRLKLQKALTFLKDKDCQFIVGSCERELPVGTDIGSILGTKHFADCLADMSGREYLQLSKPSPNFLKFLTEELGIQDPKRVLVIGDSIPSDMGLAAGAGYQKLLVLSGTTKPQQLHEWKHPENLKPDYYIESLERFKEVVNNISNTK